MKLINLQEQNSVLNQFIIEIRDKNIQKDRMKFRRNLERIGEIFAYEISKTLDYTPKEVETPLGIASCRSIKDNLVVSTILRAGLPLHIGVLNFFDFADNAFIAAYRKYSKDNKFNINIEYASTPSLEGKTLILVDTMLATGSSLLIGIEKLLEYGKPKHVHIVCPISSQDGIDNLAKHLPHKDYTLWVAAVDEELTNKSYIVPGLGDAGDLSFGEKL